MPTGTPALKTPLGTRPRALTLQAAGNFYTTDPTRRFIVSALALSWASDGGTTAGRVAIQSLAENSGDATTFDFRLEVPTVPAATPANGAAVQTGLAIPVQMSGNITLSNTSTAAVSGTLIGFDEPVPP